MVARMVRDHEVVGSNPVASTSVAAKRFLQKTVFQTVFLLLRLPLLFPKSFTTFWAPLFYRYWSVHKKTCSIASPFFVYLPFCSSAFTIIVCIPN